MRGFWRISFWRGEMKKYHCKAYGPLFSYMLFFKELYTYQMCYKMNFKSLKITKQGHSCKKLMHFLKFFHFLHWWQFSVSSFLSLLSPYLALSQPTEAKMVCIAFNSNRLNLEGYSYLQYMISLFLSAYSDIMWPFQKVLVLF